MPLFWDTHFHWDWLTGVSKQNHYAQIIHIHINSLFTHFWAPTRLLLAWRSCWKNVRSIRSIIQQSHLTEINANDYTRVIHWWIYANQYDCVIFVGRYVLVPVHSTDLYQGNRKKIKLTQAATHLDTEADRNGGSQFCPTFKSKFYFLKRNNFRLPADLRRRFSPTLCELIRTNTFLETQFAPTVLDLSGHLSVDGATVKRGLCRSKSSFEEKLVEMLPYWKNAPLAVAAVKPESILWERNVVQCNRYNFKLNM